MWGDVDQQEGWMEGRGGVRERRRVNERARREEWVAEKRDERTNGSRG